MVNIKRTCSLLATLGVVTIPLLANPQDTKKPNVLMIVVDDWGRYDLSMNSSKLYETSNIDQLGEQSNNFSQAYVAYPRSVPSRYSLITGRHCARPQEKSRGDERKVDEKSYCIAQPFKKAGYSTFLIGKWHLSHGKTMPTDKGFDYSIGAGRAGATGTYFAPFNKIGETKKDRLIYGMEDAIKGEYLTDYMTRKTVDYLSSRQKKEPFFAICSFYAVHTPLEAKENIIKKYEKKVVQLGLGIDPMKNEEAGTAKTQQDNPVYAAMIESVDEGVGKMIATLKKKGMYDNTIIVLISDHGGLSNRGKRKRMLATTNIPLKAGKGHLYEGGINVPLLIHLPGEQKEKKHNVPVMSIDLLPTLADLCDVTVDPSAEIDGVSLKPLLLKNKKTYLEKRDLFWHKADERPNSTGDYVATVVRSGAYKLLDFYLQGRVELYNIVTDPGETLNLAPQKAEVVNLLMNKIKTWRKLMKVRMRMKGDTARRDLKKQQKMAARKAARKEKRNNRK